MEVNGRALQAVAAHLGIATLVFASALITSIFSFINLKGVQ